MDWVGHPWAARTIFSSVSPSGSVTIAIPSSSRSKVLGAQNEQLPEPMHFSRSMRISTAIATSACQLSEAAVPVVHGFQPCGIRVHGEGGLGPPGAGGHVGLEAGGDARH